MSKEGTESSEGDGDDAMAVRSDLGSQENADVLNGK